MNLFSQQSGIGRILSKLAAKRGLLVSFAITAVVLGIVIVVAAAISPWHPKDNSQRTPEPSQTSAVLYQEAQQAAESGDTTGALDLANRALQADPSNEQARTLTVRLRQSADNSGNNDSNTSNNGGSSNPSNNGGSNTTSTASPDTGFLSVVPTINLLLPKAFNGYAFDTTVRSDADVSVSASPKSASDSASRIVWAIHDLKTQSEARAFVSHTSQVLYDKDEANLTVDGASGYFGTDGARFASVSYPRGRYVFEVLVTANNVQPSTLKIVTIECAKAFGDKPTN